MVERAGRFINLQSGFLNNFFLSLNKLDFLSHFTLFLQNSVLLEFLKEYQMKKLLAVQYILSFCVSFRSFLGYLVALIFVALVLV